MIQRGRYGIWINIYRSVVLSLGVIGVSSRGDISLAMYLSLFFIFACFLTGCFWRNKDAYNKND